MRRAIFAASFVDDADDIARYIEENFGRVRADRFIAELSRFCDLISDSPGVGRVNHGYSSTLHGVVFDLNWIFYEYDETEMRFVHIVDGRRDKGRVSF